MVASRIGPKRVSRYGCFGLGLLVMGVGPKQIGHQDLAALLARQPEVSERARAHMMASPFGTIHAATFSFPRPVGTLIPPPPLYRLASLSAGDADATGAIARDFSAAPLSRPQLEFPRVNRRLKGDLLTARPQPQHMPEGSRDLTPGRVKTVSFPRPNGLPARQKSEADVVTAALSPRSDNAGEARAPEPEEGAQPESSATVLASLASPEHAPLSAAPSSSMLEDGAERLGRLYFRSSPLGEVGTIQPWPMDGELLIEMPAADPDIKRSALEPQPSVEAGAASATAETVAPKGEVTGPGRRPKTPAERLALSAKERAKAEKCLAEAVYFESRGEPRRGQIAVAQVVMNRVFSGFYPSNVCGVVYQNAHRRLACQFTFACDGIPDVVTEPDMWAQAKAIARDMLDGRLWLPEIGHSTHYHAYWVHPSWVSEMKRMYRIGVHKFYRPRAWGDGSDMPPLTGTQPQGANAGAANNAAM
jgi:spore germination cell wall hydrolase CwlJ-like protein